MIRALLLDLGDTLIDSDNTVFPGVMQALGALKNFKTADDKLLVACLVSDFTMPQPRTPAAIAAAFAEYLEILDQTGLRASFEPVGQRVTLSTHAGALKPAALVFETALTRANLAIPLTDTLFITERADHIAACRQRGMTALQFGVDFTAWSAAPALILALPASGLSNA